MPILATDIIDRMESALDAEGFERYTFDNDYRQAINYAKEWMVVLFNAAFSEKKVSEENLRELIKVRIWRTSMFSRIALDEAVIGDRIWTIAAVYPEITYNGVVPAAVVGNTASVFCPNANYLRSYKSAKRLTLEEVNLNRRNPYAYGNEVTTCDELREYAYLFPADYNVVGPGRSGYFSTPAWEIEILPSFPLDLTAIAYLKYPEDITLVTDSIPFPAALTNMLVDKSLEWISYKQGDSTNLKGVTQQDIVTMAKLML